ncbi:DotU family type VI secretion system protein [Thauera sp. AutoDN2]|uniref:DotU family type VI secretion system protein n=1 Tax=Thauera sp. AutoDN2 TaxID=3416051 RepID=UPI003F4C554E
MTDASNRERPESAPGPQGVERVEGMDNFDALAEGGSARLGPGRGDGLRDERPERLQAAPSCSDNPLVRAALRVLNLLPVLRTMTAQEDPAGLHRVLADEVRFFEQQALAANVSRDEVIAARYCLCTALDETAALTPWGSRGVWARHSLLVAFHNETWGGEKFFQLLARLAQHPERHHKLIELLYLCMALGFEGKFRVQGDGHSQLEILKRRIAALLEQNAGGHEGRLSPHWAGVASVREAWRTVPPWVVATICAAIAFLVYAWFTFSLGPRSDAVYARLAGLEVPPLVLATPPPPAPPRLHRFLEAEIRAGLLEVMDLPDRSVVTLLGDGLFDSGSAEPRSAYLAVLGRIADALDEVDGEVLVTGYTDSIPMRSVRFPSNWHLSQARANSVSDLLEGQIARKGRIRSEGRGEANPRADNGSADGRARNRRVEIVVMLRTSEIQRQINRAGMPPASSPGGVR